MRLGTAVRIAMWSGPRTLSTATMRAWENRADTVVVDEPLYAFYLAAIGIDHPGRDAILASQPTDWRTVVHSLTTDDLPDGVTIACAIPRAGCAGSAPRSMCRSTPRCCRGRPGRGAPTASGRRTGTRASRRRPASARTPGT